MSPVYMYMHTCKLLNRPQTAKQIEKCKVIIILSGESELNSQNW